MNKKSLLINLSLGVGALAVIGGATGATVVALQSLSATGTTAGNIITVGNGKTQVNKDTNIAVEAPIMKEIREGYKFSLTPVATFAETIDPSQQSYVLKIVDNNKNEGEIAFADDSQEKQFKPGETINLKVTLNTGYESYTIRDLKIFNKDNPNIFLTAKQPDKNVLEFSVDMPEYDKTLDEKGKSWLYNGSEISIVPTFIVKSIGNGDNQVDWEQGAFQDSMNGYVFNLTSDMKWSEVQTEIWKAYENQDISYPIDVYFYLNGNDLILDTNKLDLQVPSGWTLNVYNNKFDTIDQKNNRYGEIKVDRSTNDFFSGQALFPFQGGLALGRSVKFDHYTTTDGVYFVNKSQLLPGTAIDLISNDPQSKNS